MTKSQTISIIEIEKSIFVIRGRRVMLDEDLAVLYGVSTKRLNEQVRRNADRFPADFAFQLNNQEVAALRSQFATLGEIIHWKYKPFAFTEHGAVMLANILKSKTAVEASIQVVRAFIRLRELAISHADLSRRVDQMEAKYDARFKIVFDAFRKLITPPEKERRKIGFILSSTPAKTA